MTLPPALVPWESELQALSTDLVLSLREAILRLSAVVGPLRAPVQSEDGEPDGFDGLSRRGSPERLLMTEWAIAEAAPMEFLRRAVDGEQAYLKLRRTQASAGRRCVVLLDGPPSQHGAPRLVHLALIIVLRARARRAGATFRWGYLCSERLHSHLGFEELRRWRNLSRWAPADAFTLERQLQKVAPTETDDLWVIGGPELEFPAAATRVTVTQPLSLKPCLEVVLTRRGSRTLRLDVPDPLPTSLFRAPPKKSASTVLPIARKGMGGCTRLWFSHCGRRLLLQRKDGFWAEHVPNSLSMALKHDHAAPRRWSASGICAIGIRGKRILGLQQVDGTLVARRFKTPTVRPSLREVRPLFVVRGEEMLLDDEGVLWNLTRDVEVARHVAATDARGYVQLLSSRAVFTPWGAGSELRRTLSTPPVRPEAAYLCGDSAAFQADGAWYLGDQVVDIGGEVFGMAQAPLPGIVHHRTRSIHHTTPQGSRELLVTPHPIAEAACSPTLPMIAWRSPCGEYIGVYDLRTERHLVLLTP